jgi:hypothetical protein
LARQRRARLIRRSMRHLFCLLSLLFFVSCKSTSLTPINTGSDPQWTGAEQYEVLVAVLAYNPETRVLFEKELAAALKKEGINAVPSFSVLPNISSLNAETFTQFLSGGPTLAVYFAQAKNVRKQQTNNNEDGDSLFSNLLGGGEWDTTFTAMMESALYVNGQTNAVWWNRVRLEAKEKKVQEVVEQYVRNEIKAMTQGGAISRLR